MHKYSVVDFKPQKVFQKALLFLIIALLFWAIFSLGEYFYSEFYENFASLSYTSFLTFVYVLISGLILFIAHKIPSIEGLKTLRNILYVGLISTTFVGILILLSPKNFDSSSVLLYFVVFFTIFMSIIYVYYRMDELKKPNKK